MIVAQENKNYFELFSVKKSSSAKFTRVNLAAQTAHFLVNYVFGRKIGSKKKQVGGKGKVGEKKKKEGKKKRA
jgi:hypothetical protein